MNKKILAVALLTITSSSAFAASETFQATVNALSDSSIANTTGLHFGAMQPTAGSVCTMDDAGAISGDCDASNGNIAIGLVTVSGLTANTPLNVTVSGSAGTNVTFASVVDIDNATGTHDAIVDNATTAVITNGSADDLAINIYGSMTVDTVLIPGDTYTADYIVDVSFQ
ncbi:MAG: hypothetical protein ABJH06_14830 [Paraglaciecola sp.]|uniref:hypothetical protein n=1 Tax=Paraglaciecola sp. TaxID=1920173 RepID=UPI003266AEE1